MLTGIDYDMYFEVANLRLGRRQPWIIIFLTLLRAAAGNVL